MKNFISILVVIVGFFGSATSFSKSAHSLFRVSINESQSASRGAECIPCGKEH